MLVLMICTDSDKVTLYATKWPKDMIEAAVHRGLVLPAPWTSPCHLWLSTILNRLLLPSTAGQICIIISIQSLLLLFTHGESPDVTGIFKTLQRPCCHWCSIDRSRTSGRSHSLQSGSTARHTLCQIIHLQLYLYMYIVLYIYKYIKHVRLRVITHSL